MRALIFALGLALAGSAAAQSTVGDALKNKPGSVGLQDADANSSSASRKAAPTAPKTSDKAAPDDTSGHGTGRTDSRKSSNGKATTGNSYL